MHTTIIECHPSEARGTWLKGLVGSHPVLYITEHGGRHELWDVHNVTGGDTYRFPLTDWGKARDAAEAILDAYPSDDERLDPDFRPLQVAHLN